MTSEQLGALLGYRVEQARESLREAEILLAALFVYHIAHAWPQHMVLWLRHLGGKLGRSSDLDGPYLLLAGAFPLQPGSPRSRTFCSSPLCT